MSFYYEKMKEITHARHGKLWKYADSQLRKIDGERLLMPTFFLDEWKVFRQREEKYTGVYMSLSNLNGVRCIRLISKRSSRLISKSYKFAKFYAKNLRNLTEKFRSIRFILLD